MMSKEEIEGILRYMDQMEYVQMKIDDLIFESMPKPKAKVSKKKKVRVKDVGEAFHDFITKSKK
jgi:hypothetical protein